MKIASDVSFTPGVRGFACVAILAGSEMKCSSFPIPHKYCFDVTTAELFGIVMACKMMSQHRTEEIHTVFSDNINAVEIANGNMPSNSELKDDLISQLVDTAHNARIRIRYSKRERFVMATPNFVSKLSLKMDLPISLMFNSTTKRVSILTS